MQSAEQQTPQAAMPSGQIAAAVNTQQPQTGSVTLTSRARSPQRPPAAGKRQGQSSSSSGRGLPSRKPPDRKPRAPSALRQSIQAADLGQGDTSTETPPAAASGSGPAQPAPKADTEDKEGTDKQSSGSKSNDKKPKNGGKK